MFDSAKDEWAGERAELHTLLDEDQWVQAERTTINAHYTDPLIITQMWRTVGALGFTGGTVLEPGSGAGSFIGLAPENARMTGVELDTVTARISAALYPHADIRAESFADTRLPTGHFDLTIGNVPFGNIALHDPVHNATGQSMHNHFILKSLALTRPGGLVTVLTSHYTMDAQNPGARREMNELADLIGAVRLPTGAHRRSAGTEVLTDLLIFRRREPDQPPRDDLWETVTPVTVDGRMVKINAYFDHHPEHMLGQIGVRQGMYGADTLTVRGNLDTLGTEKMGVGTNVQARAVALYHLDCPWRPSDIAQREGRILRQGNQNAEVAIVRFVTERSFDSYMWQGVERKATFIAQLMRGRLDTREIEEIDSSALSAAEAKAISSGNPLLLEHSTVQNEVSRLRRLERAHGRNENMLIHTRQRARGVAERVDADIRGLEAALPRVIDTSGDRFRMDITGDLYESRVDAAHALARWAHNSELKWAPRYGSRDYGTVGTISGFDIHIASHAGLGSLDIEVTLNGVPRSGFTLTRESFLEGGVGLIQRIENRASGIPGLLAHARDDLAEAQQTITEAEKRIGQPFRYSSALNEAEEDLVRIETQLAALEQGTDPAHGPDGAAPISVETVRSYPANLGSRSTSLSPSRDPFPRNDGVRHNDRPRMGL